MSNEETGGKLVASNRKARHEYFIEEKLEAGLALQGWEVKSLRAGKAQITESYASPERGELWLINANIPEFLQANRFNHAEKRPRKLLVSKKELVKLTEGVEREKAALVGTARAKRRRRALRRRGSAAQEACRLMRNCPDQEDGREAVKYQEDRAHCPVRAQSLLRRYFLQSVRALATTPSTVRS